MNCLLKLLGCCLVLCAVSCSTQYPLLYKSKAFKQCQLSCLNRYHSCKQQCVDNCQHCSAKSSYSTNKNYQKYGHQQLAQGLAVNRELNSYKDPLQCLKITCNCVADLDTCKQGCTGVIQKELITKPMPQCI